MATRCPKCGKRPMMGVTRRLLRGHYNPTNKTRKYPNLQWAMVAGSPELTKLAHGARRIKVCTDCIKTLSKTR